MTSPAGPSSPPPPPGPGRTDSVVPLDPNSPKGIEVAAQLSAVLDDIEFELAQWDAAHRSAGRAA